jgi:hypothetical protein
MNSKTILLVIGGLLVAIGLFRPNFISNNQSVDSITISKPSDVELLDECQKVTTCFTSVGGSAYDAKRLASLYMDIATLVELDGENEVVKTTEDVRQSNKLAGLMLKLDIKGKYPDLADAAKSVIVASIGDNSVPLDKNLRAKAVEGFRALAWACNQGAK